MNIDLDNVIEKINNGLESAIANLPNLLAAILVVALVYLVSKGIQKAVVAGILKAKPNSPGAHVVARLVSSVFLVLGILFASTIVIKGFSIGTLIASLGLGSVAIGFAFKDILENFIAGLYILVAQPFKIGDVIEIGDVKGTVTDLGTRAAIIQKFDREVVVMPCARLFKEEVHVVTKNNIRRLILAVGVAYSTDLDEAQEVILKAVSETESVATDPAPVATFDTFNSSSIDITIYFFTDFTQHDGRMVKSEVLKNVNTALAQHNISIPFPVRTIVETQA